MVRRDFASIVALWEPAIQFSAEVESEDPQRLVFYVQKYQAASTEKKLGASDGDIGT